MRDLPFYQDEFDAGYQAYQDGVRTPDGARVANPNRLFGETWEHARAVSWNRGWNAARRAAKRANKINA